MSKLSNFGETSGNIFFLFIYILVSKKNGNWVESFPWHFRFIKSAIAESEK